MPLSSGNLIDIPPADEPFRVKDIYTNFLKHYTENVDLSITKIDLSSANNTIIRAETSILFNKVDTNKLSISDTVVSHTDTEIEENLLVDGMITGDDIYTKFLYDRNQDVRLSFDPLDTKINSIGNLTKITVGDDITFDGNVVINGNITATSGLGGGSLEDYALIASLSDGSLTELKATTGYFDKINSLTFGNPVLDFSTEGVTTINNVYGIHFQKNGVTKFSVHDNISFNVDYISSNGNLTITGDFYAANIYNKTQIDDTFVSLASLSDGSLTDLKSTNGYIDKLYPLSTTTNGYPVINLNANVPNILGLSGISLQVGNADEKCSYIQT